MGDAVTALPGSVGVAVIRLALEDRTGDMQGMIAGLSDGNLEKLAAAADAVRVECIEMLAGKRP